MKKIRSRPFPDTHLKKHLRTLTDFALEFGATRAKPIKASDIVVDKRARLKCAIPICNYYDKNLMCPPNVISVEEFKQSLSRYSYGILIQFEMTFPEEMLKIILLRQICHI